jgi:hypothetical protein
LAKVGKSKEIFMALIHDCVLPKGILLDEHQSSVAILLDDRSQGTSKSLFNERTIGRMIIDQKSKLVMIWLLREKELGWINYSI